MKGVGDFLRKCDKFRKTVEDNSTASCVGGVLTFLVPMATLIYAVVVATQAAEREYPTQLFTKVFPSSRSNERFYLPQTVCVASEGCWVMGLITLDALDEGDAGTGTSPLPSPTPAPAEPPTVGPTPPAAPGTPDPGTPPPDPGTSPPDPGTPPPDPGTPPPDPGAPGVRRRLHSGQDRRLTTRVCRYYEEGEELLDEDRIIYYDSDPISAMTALWVGGEDFVFSYRVQEVTKISRELEVDSISPATSIGPGSEAPYKIFKGSSLMNLVLYEGLQERVESWTNTVTSEDGDIDDPFTFVCCLSAAEQDIVDRRGNVLVGDAYRPSCSSDQAKYVRLKPFPTYQVVEVLDPLTFESLWPLIGGIVSIFDATAAAIVAVYLFARSRSRAADEQDAPVTTTAVKVVSGREMAYA